MRAADASPCGAIRFSCHAARVHDHHIAGKRLALAHCAQNSRDSFAVGASRSATEVLDVKARHLF
jgi:hypothetical protein